MNPLADYLAPYRVALEILVACLLAGGGFAFGFHYKALIDSAQQVKMAQKEAQQLQSRATITASADQHHQAAAQQVKVVTRTIIKKVPVYVTKTADAHCTVNRGTVRVLDAAASMQPVPDATGQSDDAPAGIALSGLDQSVVENYGTCNAIRSQLMDLQDWITQQEQVK